MSEELIKAILQLFAIVAKEDGVQKEERSNIEEFLAENLDEEAVAGFMEWMDQYVSQSYGSKTSTMGGSDNITQDYAAIDLNCSRLNLELTHQQKMVLMLKMLELILADGSISDRESRLVEHACDALKVNREEVDLFKSYVLSRDVQDINSGDLLIINSDNVQPPSNTKHLVVANFPGFVAVLRIPEIETYFIKYEGDAPINLNGVPLKHRKIQVFLTGSTIRSQDTDPIYYSDVVSKFLSTESDSKISFIAENLSFKFPNGAIGLRDFSIAEESGKLIGIMGGSGSGKTTLLNVLNGEASPSQGKVLINQIDIHRQPDQIRGVIGYVPQDDLLMEDLTVFQNLYFAARLCFSGQSKWYLEKLVLDTLKSLGLLETKDLKVGNPLQKTISGGQRKRVNIGLELLREPSILFLDEPTSGLSSRDSENIMDLLKELSLKGKMIFVVIHQPSADIFKMFDKLVILDVGGYQIYYGNPIDAESYFKNVANLIEKDTDFGVIRPEQVFNIIERKVVNEYGRFTDHRKISPKKWYEYFKEKTKIPSVQAVEDEPRTTFKIPDRLKQLNIFTQRDLLSKISNRQYLLINLFEAPLLAFLLAYIVRFYPILGHGEHHYLFSKNVSPIASSKKTGT